MNKRNKIKQMRRYIEKYGVIITEYKRGRDSYYKKGSYYAFFDSEELDFCISAGHIDKYHVYKTIIKSIKEEIEISKVSKEGIRN